MLYFRLNCAVVVRLAVSLPHFILTSPSTLPSTHRFQLSICMSRHAVGKHVFTGHIVFAKRNTTSIACSSFPARACG